MSAVDEQDVEVVDAEVVDLEPVVGVVPYTGEQLVLSDLTDQQLAELLDEVRSFENDRLRTFVREVRQVVLSRMDASLDWTLHLDGFDVSGDSPARVDYDVDELRKVLEDLADAGLIKSEAIATVITPKKGFDVSKRGLDKLLKLGGLVKDAVEAIQRPANRSVRVTRKVTP